MRKVRLNLHTHTLYSDGDFTPEEIVRSAYQGGLTHIAITDHFETTKVFNPLLRRDLERYLRNIRAVREMYKGRIDVLAGVEIDTNPQRCDLYSLPFDMLNQLDIVLFEYVEDPKWGGIPLNELRSLTKGLGVPFGFCHWDMARIFERREGDWLATKLHDMGAFVEVSTSPHYVREGRYLYEHSERFYRAFRGRVPVSIGTDTHHNLSEAQNIGRGEDFIYKMELENDTLFQWK